MSPKETAALSGPEYFGLAYRLPAYPGIMRARVEQDEKKQTRNVRHGHKLVESDRTSIERDSLLADLIEF